MNRLKQDSQIIYLIQTFIQKSSFKPVTEDVQPCCYSHWKHADEVVKQTETLTCTVCSILHRLDVSHFSENVVSTIQITPKPLYSLVLATILILFKQLFLFEWRERFTHMKKCTFLLLGQYIAFNLLSNTRGCCNKLISLSQKKNRSVFLHSALQHFLKNWLTLFL